MSSSPVDSATSPTAARPPVVFFANGLYARHIAGGDMDLTRMARAAVDARYPVHFIGGHALSWFLERQDLPRNQTVTDRKIADIGDAGSVGGQIKLLFDYARRLFNTLRKLKEVPRDSIAIAISDFWWDMLPLVLCRARVKIFFVGMVAPTLGQVLFKTRADVPASRFGSLHYWFSQQFSARLFRLCCDGFVIYGHPDTRDYLLRFGYRDSQLAYVSTSVDVASADSVPAQPKQFDVAWTGRVHPQKGIDDLLATLKWLGNRLPDFRAVIIGKSKDALEGPVRELGLAASVTFSGLVSEQEKFRLLKASRVFVMPSRYESWGIVVGEALVSATPVVAYELQCYRPVFGDCVRYVQPFDSDAFRRAVEDEVRNQRAGKNYLQEAELKKLKQAVSWQSSQDAFRKLLSDVEQKSA